MLSTTHNFTPAGRIKRPSYSTVATWVKESWDEVDNNLIQRSFKYYEILTKTDSSEDHDYDKLSDLINDEDNEIIEVVDDEEYVKEDDYENEWNVKNNNNNKNEDEDQDQELSSTDNEEEMNELRKKYKGK